MPNNNATKINDYNKFLSILDKSKKKENTIIPLTRINEVIKTIEKNYKENRFNSMNFAGWGTYDVIKSKIKTNDANEYIDFNIEEKSSRKKHDFKLDLDLLDCDIERKTITKETFLKETIIKEKVNISFQVNTIEDILKLIDMYPLNEKIEYNINMELLYNIKEPLIELNNMIGMNNLKKNILDQILYYLQELHLLGNDFMHTVIYGPPGTGKTEIAQMIGKIYTKMGILKGGTFQKVTRSDLVSGYLGQTALKTRDVIKDSLGGVLFIDEAYALGNPEKRDSFSKECIDTLCESLSNHKDNLMVIIAGYENELKECFFSYNRGLVSRFTWRFKTDEYTAEDLKNIFFKKVKDISWEIKDNLDNDWFEKNMDYFKFYGRDIEVLLSKIKIVHSKRIFGKSVEEKKKITMLDMENGLKLFLANDEVKERKYTPSKALASMYI